MKVKTSELIGKALDWAVWYILYGTLTREELDKDINLLAAAVDRRFNPSEDWAKGGPILEDQGISTRKGHSGWWIAYVLDINDEETFMAIAPTKLVAAMRCFIASRLGDEVEIPWIKE